MSKKHELILRLWPIYKRLLALTIAVSILLFFAFGASRFFEYNRKYSEYSCDTSGLDIRLVRDGHEVSSKDCKIGDGYKYGDMPTWYGYELIYVLDGFILADKKIYMKSERARSFFDGFPESLNEEGRKDLEAFKIISANEMSSLDKELLNDAVKYGFKYSKWAFVSLLALLILPVLAGWLVLGSPLAFIKIGKATA